MFEVVKEKWKKIKEFIEKIKKPLLLVIGVVLLVVTLGEKLTRRKGKDSSSSTAKPPPTTLDGVSQGQATINQINTKIEELKTKIEQQKQNELDIKTKHKKAEEDIVNETDVGKLLEKIKESL